MCIALVPTIYLDRMVMILRGDVDLELMIGRYNGEGKIGGM